MGTWEYKFVINGINWSGLKNKESSNSPYYNVILRRENKPNKKSLTEI